MRRPRSGDFVHWYDKQTEVLTFFFFFFNDSKGKEGHPLIQRSAFGSTGHRTLKSHFDPYRQVCSLQSNISFHHSDTKQKQPHLKHAFVQQPRSKHRDSLRADVGVKTSQQLQSFVFDTVKIQSHCLALHTVGYPVPPGRKARGQMVSVFLVNYCAGRLGAGGETFI